MSYFPILPMYSTDHRFRCRPYKVAFAARIYHITLDSGNRYWTTQPGLSFSPEAGNASASAAEVRRARWA